jgi:chromate transporter
LVILIKFSVALSLLFIKKEIGEKMKQANIFMAFLRVGMLGFGGGPASIPLIQREVVEKYKWMKDEDFGDMLALGNALPGPIATKLAGYIGYRIGGFWGMVNAVLATIIPTIVLMIILLKSLNAYKDEAWVKGMSSAVVPVVGVMLLKMTLNFIQKSRKSSLGLMWTLLLIVVGIILLEFMHVHPAILIFALLLGALLKKDKKPAQDKGADS